ncbi:MAG: type II secretion system protein GspF [Desulfobacterales bacterium]|nr:type II secretion system protein GspF [Desulfobacterales bacterium]
MTRQLATLLGAGFPLVTALDTLIPQTGSALLKKTLARVKDAVVEGQSFARALGQYPGIFSSLFVNMVKAGESSGTLEIILERLADISEKQVALANRIKTTLAYPVFMSFFGALVLFLLLAFIVPNITAIFEDMQQVLPLPTRLLIATSDLLQIYWGLILIVIAVLFLTMRLFKSTARGQSAVDRIGLALPIAGAMVRKLAVARFTRTLGSLLENGVSMMPALETVEGIAGNVHIAAAVRKAAAEVERGQSLGNALAASKTFPDLAIQIIQVGEQSGNLEPMLVKAADIFENEVEGQLLRITSLLEPAMIVLMGGIVGFIVIAVCLPIFEMNQLIR